MRVLVKTLIVWSIICFLVEMTRERDGLVNELMIEKGELDVRGD